MSVTSLDSGKKSIPVMVPCNPVLKCYNSAVEFASSIVSGGSPSTTGNNNAGGKKKTVYFNMASLSGKNCSTNETDTPFDSFVDKAIGLLVDDGAPYSVIGNFKLR